MLNIKNVDGVLNEDEILNDIKEIIRYSHGSENITMDTYLEYGDGSGLNMSSLEIVNFIINLEDKYNIIINFEDRFYTIGDCVRTVRAYMVEKYISKLEDEDGL